MTTDDTAPVDDHRWGRYTLLAAIVTLTAVGATAIGVGALRTDAAEPPISAGSTAAGGSAAAGSTAAGPAAVPSTDVDRAPAAATGGSGREVLTSGPLMPTSVPVRVSIPALKVSAPIIGLGRLADGSMAVPGDARTVGWYDQAPTPGSLGPAILAGHVDFRSKPGTFAKLRTLRTGAMISVERTDGSVAMFAVTAVQRYAKDRFPSADVYGAIDHAGLRLITCGGAFDATRGHYEDNIVVYAILRHSHPA
jgi:hypothetical protein